MGRDRFRPSTVPERFRSFYDVLLRLWTFFFIIIRIPVERLKKVTKDRNRS
jgi:hypothetical protein